MCELTCLTVHYQFSVRVRTQEYVLGFWLIGGSALGPIGGLSARQFNSCLPRGEEKREEYGLVPVSTFSF